MNQQPLRQRYLLVVNIPVYRHGGRLFTEDLWVHDLRRHLHYILDLRLFCPVVDGEPPAGSSELPTDEGPGRLSLAAVPRAKSMLHGLLLAPLHMLLAWRHVGQADIVHGGAIGWPIPLGYYAAFAARWRRRFHISVMESSPWRLTAPLAASRKQRFMAWFMERRARRIARQSALSLFTTREYQTSMTGAGHPTSHVFKASWISEQSILGETECRQRWQARASRQRPKIGFAARLVREKGAGILLEALTRLAAAGLALDVVVLGEGPMAPDFESAARSGNAVRIDLRGRVPFGPEFYAVVDEVDVFVVPSLSEEQPRIVYDAFSRGIPVVASNTSALAECVTDGRDGCLFGVGDAGDLARILQRCLHDRAELARMGMNARATALTQTHERMHAERHRLIAEAWQDWTGNRR